MISEIQKVFWKALHATLPLATIRSCATIRKFFDEMKMIVLEVGFEAVASGILVRSSYFAEKLGG